MLKSISESELVGPMVAMVLVGWVLAWLVCWLWLCNPNLLVGNAFGS
jgi:hypothetical protein